MADVIIYFVQLRNYQPHACDQCFELSLDKYCKIILSYDFVSGRDTVLYNKINYPLMY